MIWYDLFIFAQDSASTKKSKIKDLFVVNQPICSFSHQSQLK